MIYNSYIDLYMNTLCQNIFSSLYVMSENAIIGELATLLKDGHLSEQILEFIKYKFDRYNKYDFSYRIKDIFQIMLRDSMTYHIQEKCRDVIEREINIFSNMLEIVRLWNHFLGTLDNQVISYLQHNNRSKLNLKGIKLGYVNLRRVYLDGADLNDADLNGTNLEKAELNGAGLREAQLNGANMQGAYMEGADFSGADLISARFPNANLEKAELIGARLINANLSGAKLNGAILSRAELNGADLRGAELYEIEISGTYLRDAIFDESQVNMLSVKCDLSSSKIYIFATKEIISYKEYCKRMQ